MERFGHLLLKMQMTLTIHIEDQLECTGLAVQCLSVISHIDYDLVLPCVPRILPLILQVYTVVQYNRYPLTLSARYLWQASLISPSLTFFSATTQKLAPWLHLWRVFTRQSPSREPVLVARCKSIKFAPPALSCILPTWSTLQGHYEHF